LVFLGPALKIFEISITKLHEFFNRSQSPVQIIDTLLHTIVNWRGLLAAAHRACECVDLLLEATKPGGNIVELILVVAVLLDSTFKVIVRILEAVDNALHIAQGFLGGSANVIVP